MSKYKAHVKDRRRAGSAFAHRLRRRVVPTGSGSLGQATIHYRADHLLSTFRRQAGILARVHSVLRESLLFGDISVPGQDHMDNVLRFTLERAKLTKLDYCQQPPREIVDAPFNRLGLISPVIPVSCW